MNGALMNGGLTVSAFAKATADASRADPRDPVPERRRPTFGVFVERQTLGARGARRSRGARWSRRSGCRPGRCRSIRIIAPLRAPAAREERWKGLTVHRPRFRVWPGLGASRDGAAHGGRAAAAAARDPRALPVRRDRRRILLAGRARRRCTSPRRWACPSRSRRAAATSIIWGRRPGIAAQIVEAGRARRRAARGQRARSRRDMAALGMPEEKIRVHHTGIDLDRFRPVDRAAAKAALGRRRAADRHAPATSIPLKGQGLAIEALARAARRDPAPRRRRARSGRRSRR